MMSFLTRGCLLVILENRPSLPNSSLCWGALFDFVLNSTVIDNIVWSGRWVWSITIWKGVEDTPACKKTLWSFHLTHCYIGLSLQKRYLKSHCFRLIRWTRFWLFIFVHCSMSSFNWRLALNSQNVCGYTQDVTSKVSFFMILSAAFELNIVF